MANYLSLFPVFEPIRSSEQDDAISEREFTKMPHSFVEYIFLKLSQKSGHLIFVCSHEKHVSVDKPKLHKFGCVRNVV